MSVVGAEYRPPWTALHVIGIGGASGSGKTTVAQKLIKTLNVPWVVILSLDSFYKPLTKEESARAFKNEYDFDDPSALDWDLLFECLSALKQGKKVEIPQYSFALHNRLPTKTTIYACNIIILEGIFTLHDPRILSLLDMKIFVDTPSDICLARRLNRDILHRGRDLRGVLTQYNRYVKRSYDDCVRPTMKNADIVVPRSDSHVALDMITQHIRQALAERSRKHLEALRALQSSPTSSADELGGLRNIICLPQTPQLHAMQTIIRDANTSRDDFQFYLERLAVLLIERAMVELPHEQITIETPTGKSCTGMALSASEVVGVSIVRAGETLEVGLRRVIPDVSLGKILIQSESMTGEPKLHYSKIPPLSPTGHVFLLDAQIATGAAALMAIRVLLDHGVPEENVVFIAYLAAPSGLQAIARVYPKVRVVVSVIDEGLMHPTAFIVPGFGNIGDRYFGC
ncbi:uridine kinase [Saitoella complicata NRRL Y-17804]|uniref:Uridine kinase n=1 Tax=Saitoella complicata (strain BCRC 22490 / CBS 7301 / JCM 7358 / NBRC 10748 / NRRL Y-17804) TaxID=698492 RepID=A0A0E9NB15_SAICN|nr:uridine kinase [Saitoella complicata NRRL Y-17804]ODQ53808.1 uridine kinase [Saitoella complicata NRRL Y-17804]GAO46993.1 hypothetical protein G7K_1207-t1 [Saitoella complicata NRRL Y-17804]